MSETKGAPARPSKGLLVSRGVSIVGSLSLQGEVVIEGAVDGEVRCTSVQISERGVVDGLIVADKVIVLGEFVGAIYAKEILLGAACSVEGHIFHRKLVLEEGCYFEGKSRCYTNPLAHAPAAEPPPWSGEELTAAFG
jgi:cytoskeletal protein CcmA (bactofilin family)